MFTTVCFMLCVLCIPNLAADSAIKSPDRQVTAKVGKNVRLKCAIPNWQPTWKLNWYMNGKRIRVNKNKRLRVQKGKLSILRIKNVQTKDAGLYKCAAWNKHERIERTMNVTVVLGVPWFEKTRLVIFPASTDIKLRCPIIGKLALKFLWLKDGKAFKYRGLDPNIKTTRRYLRIRAASLWDTGLYTCIVHTRLGEISQNFKLVILERTSTRPIISVNFPTNKTARVGENVTFICLELYSGSLFHYRWLHWHSLPASYPDLKLGTKNESLQLSNYSLINPAVYTTFSVAHERGTQRLFGVKVSLNNVTKEDEGMYTCAVSNNFGVTWRSTFLKILPAGTESSLPFDEMTKKKKHLQSMGNPFNDIGRMACSISVEPKTRLARTLNFRSLNVKQRLKKTRQFTIVLKKQAFSEENGTYPCKVSNQYESINMTFEYTGREFSGPLLEDFQDVTVTEGEDVILTCKAYNNNKPKLIWFVFDDATKEYNIIQQGNHTQLTSVENKEQGWQGERLRLVDVTHVDKPTKQYLCFGVNAVGTRQRLVSVKVIPKKAEEIPYPG